ncbi:MAG: hypothetical protein SOR72_00270 [Hornefia sp.]|nr:hypothetical protein [Hornefia sp.]
MKKGHIMRFIRSVLLVVIAVAVVYLSIYICISNSDWVYVFARLFGFKEKHANNISLLAIALQSLFFTSDWFYNHISAFIDRKLERANELNSQIYMGYKAGVEFLIALPKRTILFSFYLLLITMESVGLIDKAKDYAAVIIFIIAIDRVTKIWPEEKKRLREFGSRIKKHVKDIE